MHTETSLPVDPNSVTSVSKSNLEPEWLTTMRLHALELASQLELPKLEKTRIDRWNLEPTGTFRAAQQIANLSELPEHMESFIQSFESDNIIVQIDSGVVYQKLSKELQDQGVIYTDLGRACREYPELVRPHLGNAIKANENRLTALHTAHWNGGVFLYVPKNVIIDQPVQALFVSEQGEVSFMPHILIVAEENSSVTYVDYAVSMEGDVALVHNSATEVFAQANARVRCASAHHLREEMTDITYRRAIIERDARVEWIIGALNDGNTMTDTTSVLMGDGSSTDGKEICVGSGKQKLSLTTTANHHGRHTKSDMITRAVMKDEATAIVNGITKIEKGATHSNGEQIQRILMLSPKSRGDANPMLLIDEDEVLAGHAASAGQVNLDQIYYLMTRGISEEEAKMLIIRGFLAPILSEIPLDNIRTKLSELLERKL